MTVIVRECFQDGMGNKKSAGKRCGKMEEEKLKKKNARFRCVLGFAALALSLLLVGAGKMNASTQAEKQELESSRRQCMQAARDIALEIPAENRNAWNDMAKSSPEFCIRASSRIFPKKD